MKALSLSSASKPISLLITLCLFCLNTQAATILVHGDSLSAGYGLQQGQAWPDQLQQRLHDEGFSHYRVINSSISGETTAGGLQRFPALWQQHRPTLLILELGANDGLRGQSIKTMRSNLSRMIESAQQQGAEVILAGIHIPPNYGKRYSQAFYQSYPKLQQQHQTALIPFLLEGIATNSQLMQGDGLHPTAAAQTLIVDTVWKTLHPLLQPPE